LPSEKNEAETEEQTAKDYYNKAIVIVQKAEKGEVETAEADRLAKEALKRQTFPGKCKIICRKNTKNNMMNVKRCRPISII
jgi:phage shock protein A